MAEIVGFISNNSLGDATCTRAFHKHGIWTDAGADGGPGKETAPRRRIRWGLVCWKLTVPMFSMSALKVSIPSMFTATFVIKRLYLVARRPLVLIGVFYPLADLTISPDVRE